MRKTSHLDTTTAWIARKRVERPLVPVAETAALRSVGVLACGLRPRLEADLVGVSRRAERKNGLRNVDWHYIRVCAVPLIAR